MFGLTDIKKINERAAAKAAEGRYKAEGRHVLRTLETGTVLEVAVAGHPQAATRIADALNLADAFKEAQAEAVGRT